MELVVIGTNKTSNPSRIFDGTTSIFDDLITIIVRTSFKEIIENKCRVTTCALWKLRRLSGSTKPVIGFYRISTSTAFI